MLIASSPLFAALVNAVIQRTLKEAEMDRDIYEIKTSDAFAIKDSGRQAHNTACPRAPHQLYGPSQPAVRPCTLARSARLSRRGS